MLLAEDTAASNYALYPPQPFRIYRHRRAVATFDRPLGPDRVQPE